jgi:MFS family permease
MISMGFLFLNREAPRPPKTESIGLIAYFRRIPGLLRRDRNFSMFIVCRILLTLATMATAFYTVYAVDRLGASDGMVANYTAVLLATQLPANLLLGYMGDKLGQRSVMQMTALCIALAALTALVSPDTTVFALVWVFLATATSGFLLVNMAMIVEFATPNERPTYVAIGLGLGAPVSFAAPLVGGWIAGSAGYFPLFTSVIVLSIVAFLAITRFVADPRKTNHEAHVQAEVT